MASTELRVFMSLNIKSSSAVQKWKTQSSVATGVQSDCFGDHQGERADVIGKLYLSEW